MSNIQRKNPAASTPPRGRIPGNIWSAGDGYLISPPQICHIVVFIIVNSGQTVHIIWRNGWRKIHKNAQICTLQFKHFPGGYAPEPPCWGGATAPIRKPYPLGTTRLGRGLNRPRPMFVSRWLTTLGEPQNLQQERHQGKQKKTSNFVIYITKVDCTIHRDLH